MKEPEAPSPPGESSKEVVRRLMRLGGCIIVAGGEMGDLPQRYTTHPQILIWDDNHQGIQHKTVPSNTRGIVFNTWISHANVARLRNAAKQLGIPIFPFLKKREVIEVLDYITAQEATPPPIAEEVHEVEIQEPEPEPVTNGLLMEEDTLRKPKRNEMTGVILPKELRDTETPVQGADRLLPILKERYNLKMTRPAVVQAIIRFRKGGGKSNPRLAPDTSLTRTSGTKSKIGVMDEFAEGERLLREARTAIDAFLEFLPKLRKQASDLTRRQEKIREILGD